MNQENNNSKICPICGRPTHKESKYCVFHAGAEEKTEEDFKQALKEGEIPGSNLYPWQIV